MKSNLYTLNYKDIVSSGVSAIIVSVLGYVLSVGDIFALNYYAIANIAVMTAATSLLKSLLTDSNGDLLGKIPVK